MGNTRRVRKGQWTWRCALCGEETQLAGWEGSHGFPPPMDRRWAPTACDTGRWGSHTWRVVGFVPGEGTVEVTAGRL